MYIQWKHLRNSSYPNESCCYATVSTNNKPNVIYLSTAAPKRIVIGRDDINNGALPRAYFDWLRWTVLKGGCSVLDQWRFVTVLMYNLDKPRVDIVIYQNIDRNIYFDRYNCVKLSLYKEKLVKVWYIIAFDFDIKIYINR